MRLGHSGGLGTSFSRNAALTGHNSCCCAASLPGMGFLGHALESHGALLPPPSPGAPLCPLQLHFPSPKCIKKLNFPPNPSQPILSSLPEVIRLGTNMAKPGGSRGLAHAHLPLPVFRELFPHPVLYPDRPLLCLWKFVQCVRKRRASLRALYCFRLPVIHPLVFFWVLCFYILTSECMEFDPKAEKSQSAALRPHHCGRFYILISKCLW